MTVYVCREGRWFDKRTGEPMELPKGDVITAPRIMSDIEDYRSPIDGRTIGGRAGQREDLKRSDCVLAPPPKEKKGYRNPTFAKKRGLKLREDVLHG
jgi:hypothetical protein